MDELHDLVKILEDKLNYIDSDWAHISAGLPPNQATLLGMILSESSLTDEEASEALYKTEPTVESYRHVKRELRQFLFQLILTYRPSKHHNSAIQVAYYQSEQLLAVMNSLIGFGNSSLARDIAKQLLNKARKYHFTNITCEAAQYLSRMYALNKKTQHKFYEMSALALEANRIRSYELRAEQAYSQLLIAFNDKKENDHVASQQAIASYQELTIYETQRIESYKFYMSYYLLGIMAYEAIGDYNTSLEKSVHAFEYFDTLSYDHRVAKAIFLNHLTVAQIQLRQLKAAAATSDQALQYLKAGTQNWSQSYYYFIKIKIMYQEYDEAYLKYSELASNRSFKELPADKRVALSLMGAYLDFLVFIKVIESDDNPKRFNFQKFRLSYPEVDADTRGMRITITVLEALYHIIDKEFSDFNRKVEALQGYCSRSLKSNSPYHRSSCFIKLLLLIPVNRYTKTAIHRKARIYLQRMALDPLTIEVRESVAIEIINYEHLWAMVMELFIGPKRITKEMKEQIELLKK